MHTWNTQDIAGYFSCLHEDYQMIFHSTGKILRLEDFDMDQLARWMISTTRESARCVYENDDILVVLGKGRENYQLIENEKIFHSDYEIIIEYINEN
mgnify:CR=1 FL=1